MSLALRWSSATRRCKTPYRFPCCGLFRERVLNIKTPTERVREPGRGESHSAV
jgi:hypothetical protein